MTSKDKKPIKTAVIGCGSWGQFLIQTLHQNSDYHLRYFCDPDQSELDQLKSQFGYVVSTGDMDLVLNDIEVDAVIVAVPLIKHYEVAKKCLLRGKHVFLEQPMAGTSADCEELIRIAEKEDRFLMVGHIDNFNLALQYVKNYLSEGKLGEIHYIYGQRLNLGGHIYQSNCLWELLSHDLYILQELLGFIPSSFNVNGMAAINSDQKDVIFLSMKIGDDAMANFIAGWMHPLKVRNFTIVGQKMTLVYNDIEPSNKITLFDSSVVAVDSDRQETRLQSFGEFQTRTHTGDIIMPSIDLEEPLKLELQCFADCLNKHSYDPTHALSGSRIIRLLEQIQQVMDKDKWNPLVPNS